MSNKGIGGWQYNMTITNAVTLILTMSNIVSNMLGRFGIKLPGLTVWSLCRKQLLQPGILSNLQMLGPKKINQ